MARGYRYAIYLDAIEDGTTFDPACPYHGEDGSMVATFASYCPHCHTGDPGEDYCGSCGEALADG